MSDVAYNPSDPVQQQFLSSLALGETGNAGSSAYSEGVGGVSLAGASTDAYGFPQWQGQGNSHAAGAFQFQPGTWDSIAQEYGLNFANSADQAAGAWYLAQQTYAQNTGGQSLEDALTSGQYSSIQSALASVWPSVTGNQAAPQGLANDLASGTGASLGLPSNMATSGSGSSSSSASGGIVGTIENFFVRFGLIILGGIIIIVALWQLLSEQGVVPSPAQTAKGAGKALATLA